MEKFHHGRFTKRIPFTSNFIFTFFYLCFILVVPPLFVRSLESKDVVKGSELILECQVSGSAPFTVSLSKNGKAIRNDKRHRISVKDDLIALQVLAVEPGDVGLYQCTVENEVGRVSCDSHVTLKGWSGCPRHRVVNGVVVEVE